MGSCAGKQKSIKPIRAKVRIKISDNAILDK
jgi:hypothetical protein